MKINIFDFYNADTKKIMRSLKKAGITRKNLFVHYQGDLPEEGLSPFTFFMNIKHNEVVKKGLFFNRVQVPAFHDIRHFDGTSANIEFLKDKVGKIHYRKEGYRLVETVDWYAKINTNEVAKRDHYNSYGTHYATTYYSHQEPYQTHYYREGKTVIIEHRQSKHIQLFQGKSVYNFKNMTEFFMYFLGVVHIKRIDDIYINSLSFPLFISRQLTNKKAKTTLFWQENMAEDVPGNMQQELEKRGALKRIIFNQERHLTQVRNAYSSTNVELGYLSNIGEFNRESQYRAKAFILTNSDNIEGLEDILRTFPDLGMTVAAFTNMSNRLLTLENKYLNLRLIPSIDEARLTKELQGADIYLDINHGAKVGNILEAAYREHMLILSHKSVKQESYVSLEHTNIEEVCNSLSEVLPSKRKWSVLLKRMYESNGPQSNVADYIELLQ